MKYRLNPILTGIFGFCLAMVICLSNSDDAHAAPADQCVVHNNYAICGDHTCATVSNTTDVAAWRDSQNRVFTATFKDRGVLIWNRAVPRSVKLAAAKLRKGKRGPKIARACADPIRVVREGDEVKTIDEYDNTVPGCHEDDVAWDAEVEVWICLPDDLRGPVA